MFSGNLYGLIIALLTLAITVVVAMRNMDEKGLRIELVIQPARQYLPERRAEEKTRDRQDAGSDAQVAERKQGVVK